MVLKPQDIVVALKLAAIHDMRWTYVQLYHQLFISASEINAGIRRLSQAGLVTTQSDESINPPRLNRSALMEFLVHGIKYAYPPERGELTRGMPTGYAAPPLLSKIVQPDEPPPVWPDPEGTVRGYSFAPLYRTVPKAARQDTLLYELLALVDAIRDGRARERAIAEKELMARIRTK